MNDDETEIQGWLSGAQADPRTIQRLQHDVTFRHALLREAWFEDALAREVMARALREGLTTRQRPNRVIRWRWPVLASAAALVLSALGLLAYLSGRAPAADVLATVQLSTGAAMVQRWQATGGSPEPVEGSIQLRAGDAVQVLAGGQALCSLRDSAATIRLDQLSVLRLDPAGDTSRLELVTGSLSAQINPRQVGAPLRLSTRHATATILGTELQLSVDGEATHLKVLHGLVAFANRDGLDIPVGSGASAIVRSGQLIRERTALAPAARILRHWGFEEIGVPGLSAGARISGGADGRGHAVQGGPFAPAEDIRAVCLTDGGRTLFTYDPETVISFAYLLRGTDALDVLCFSLTASSNFRLQLTGLAEGVWQRAEFQLKDLQHVSVPSTLVPADAAFINLLIIGGRLATSDLLIDDVTLCQPIGSSSDGAAF